MKYVEQKVINNKKGIDVRYTGVPGTTKLVNPNRYQAKMEFEEQEDERLKKLNTLFHALRFLEKAEQKEKKTGEKAELAKWKQPDCTEGFYKFRKIANEEYLEEVTHGPFAYFRELIGWSRRYDTHFSPEKLKAFEAIPPGLKPLYQLNGGSFCNVRSQMEANGFAHTYDDDYNLQWSLYRHTPDMLKNIRKYQKISGMPEFTAWRKDGLWNNYKSH